MRTLLISALILLGLPAVAQKPKKTAQAEAAAAKPEAAKPEAAKPEAAKPAEKDETPTLKFATAPLVGHAVRDVWVVPKQEDEVFVLNRKLYLRTKSGRWFYAANLQGYWYPLDADRVPEDLTAIPLGKYRRWPGKGERLVPAELGATEQAAPELGTPRTNKSRATDDD